MNRLERVERSMSNDDLKKCFTTITEREAKSSVSREINRRARMRNRKNHA